MENISSKIIKVVNYVYKDIISMVVMMTAVLIIMSRLYNLQNIDWNIPLYYNGGDGMTYLVDAKLMEEEGWMMQSSRLAAPFGSNDNDFYASNLHNVDMMILKAIVNVVHNPATATNLLFLSIFPLIAIFTYFVLRNMRVRPWVSAVGGMLYCFTPYVFMRGMGHFVLSSYYFIPISILLCLWIFEDNRLFRLDRRFFLYWKNYFAIIVTVLIANNGIAYYPFFTCFFLLITGISMLIKTKKLAYLGKSITLVALISANVVIALLPSIRYIMENGSNKDAVYRTVDGAESFGLKIAQLILPVQAHGVEYLDKIITTYNTEMPLINENSTAYLGVVGIIGFITLIFTLFVRNMSEDRLYKKHLILLSELNVFAVLLGTIGGFSSLFCVVISPLIRCYNRISIFISFFAIAGICVIISAVCDRIVAGKALAVAENSADIDNEKPVNTTKVNLRWLWQIPIAVIVGFVAIFSVYEGFVQSEGLDYEANKVSYTFDAKFMQQIEDTLEDGALVFQLPNHEYPESGPVIDMLDYDLFRGFVHSTTIKWSYGGTKGRESDAFNKAIVELPTMVDIVDELLKNGFSGIYIDRYAFEPEDQEELENTLKEITGKEPIVSEDERLSFFDITEVVDGVNTIGNIN